MKIYAIGTATLDIFFVSNNLDFLKNLKEKNDIEGYFVDIGGGGLNFAYNFKKLGLDSTAIVKIGNDFVSKVIKKRIEEKGIKAHVITTRGNSSISFIFLNKTNGKKYIFTHRGDENFTFKDLPITKNNAYYISTGRTNINTWLKFFRHLKENNNFVGVNPSKYFLKNTRKIDCFNNIDFLNINYEEALLIINRNFKKIDLLKELRRKLNSVKYLLITDGSNGAWFLTRNNIYHSTIYEKLKVVDTTGAGDSFGSTVFAFLVKNKFKEEETVFKIALKYATFTTAHNLTKIGAQTGLLSLKELRKLKNKELKIIIYRL